MVAQLLVPRDTGKKPRSLLARLDSHAIPRRVTAVLALVGVALGSLSQSGGPDRVDACNQEYEGGHPPVRARPELQHDHLKAQFAICDCMQPNADTSLAREISVVSRVSRCCRRSGGALG